MGASGPGQPSSRSVGLDPSGGWLSPGWGYEAGSLAKGEEGIVGMAGPGKQLGHDRRTINSVKSTNEGQEGLGGPAGPHRGSGGLSGAS
jgi:hypothetical protein